LVRVWFYSHLYNFVLSGTPNLNWINTAEVDLAFLVVCVPFTAVKYGATSWPLGDAACRVVNYLLFLRHRRV